MASLNVENGLTLTVIGSGTMGIAILAGIMSSLSELRDGGSSFDDKEVLPERLPTKFIACNRREATAKTVRDVLGIHNFPLTTLTNENVKGVQSADIVLLSCKPYVVKHILGEDGMTEALAGKVLISVLGGMTEEQIEEILYPLGAANEPNKCHVLRVMPNTASHVREGMSVIATRVPAIPPQKASLVSWMFSRIGGVVHLPASLMDASTSLSGAGPAYCALLIEALADGAVAMGVPRAEALLMAAQSMKGAASLVLNGEHPGALVHKVCQPGSGAVAGMLTLENGGMHGTIGRAIREVAAVSARIGQGLPNVNGIRN